MWVLISSELAQKNIKLITKLDLLGLSTYLVGTWLISIDSSKLKESATSLRVLVYIEW